LTVCYGTKTIICVHKGISVAQMKSVHSHTSYSFKIHLNIMWSSVLWLNLHLFNWAFWLSGCSAVLLTDCLTAWLAVYSAVWLSECTRIATGYGLDGRGSILGKGKIFLLSIASTPGLGSTQPPVQWVPKALCPGVKRPELEADHFYLVLRSRMVDLYLHSSRCLHDIVLNYLSTAKFLFIFYTYTSTVTSAKWWGNENMEMMRHANRLLRWPLATA
jgi:hypothetical protein